MAFGIWKRCLLQLTIFGTSLSAQDSLSILWLGNSLSSSETSRLFEVDKGCKQVGIRCSLTYGAYQYDAAWGWYNAPENKAKVESGNWDYVVLQVFGGSGTHIVSSHYNDFSMDSMKATVREWDKLIKKSGAKTILYLPWGTDGYTPSWDASANAWKPDRMDTTLAHLKEIGKELGAWIFPVGAAQWDMLKNHATIPMWSDWIHGTQEAGYLGGLVCFSALTGYDPRKVENFYNLSASTLDVLRQVAYQTVNRTDFLPLQHAREGTSTLKPLKGKSGLSLEILPNRNAPGINLKYSGVGTAAAEILILAPTGKCVRRLAAPGRNGLVEWDGLTENRALAGPGNYFARLKAGRTDGKSVSFIKAK